MTTQTKSDELAKKYAKEIIVSTNVSNTINIIDAQLNSFLQNVNTTMGKALKRVIWRKILKILKQNNQQTLLEQRLSFTKFAASNDEAMNLIEELLRRK